jgi:type IV pilus assembly protein PilW
MTHTFFSVRFNFPDSRQSGFSIAELMVASVLSMLVILALSVLFMNINRTNTELAKTNSQIENGRFALQILQEDVAHAGFWGEYVPEFDNLTSKASPEGAPLLIPTTPRAVPDPCLPFASWTEQHIHNLLGIPVQLHRETQPKGAGCTTDFSANRKAGTDLLVVRHAETCIAGAGGNCDDDVSGRLYFQASRTYNNFCPAPLVSETRPFVLSNLSADFNNMKDKDCATNILRKRKFISNIYYIRDYAITQGDGIPTLMLSSQSGTLTHAAAQPLVEGIEAFHVELGIDNKSDSGADVNYANSIVWANPSHLTSPTNRGDGVPDIFVSCADAAPACDALQLANAVVVKLYVLARADSPTVGYTDTKSYNLGTLEIQPFHDNYKRHVFSTTVRIQNVAGRRLTP